MTDPNTLTNAGPDTLDAIVDALGAGQIVPPERWHAMHSAIFAAGQAPALVQQYDQMAASKKVKALQPPALADFYLNAGRIYRDALRDAAKTTVAFERSLAADPQNEATFAELRMLFEQTRDMRKLAELLHKSASMRLPEVRVDQLRAAAAIYGSLNMRDKAMEALTQATREAPGSIELQDQLEELLRQAGRPRDLCKVIETALQEDIPADQKRRMRAKLLLLYGQELGEMEKALPHAEALLQEDPERQDARYICEQLLSHRALAGRAATALGEAFEKTGNVPDLLRCLMVELENTRGPKRKDVALKLATIREERLGDFAGALQALEQAIAVDAGDEEARRRFVALSSRGGNALEAAKTLSRVMNAAKESKARSRIAADMGELLRVGGDAKRARTTFLGITSTTGSDPEAVLVASRGLSHLYAEDKEAKPLADVLEKVATLSQDPEEVIAASLRLATIAEARLQDVARAAEAWKRLLPTRARKEALGNLAAICERQGDALGHAHVLRERAEDASREGATAEARRLMVEAARLYAHEDRDLEQAIATWNSIKETFPYEADVADALVPMLKRLSRHQELEALLLLDLARAAHPDRVPWLVELGELRTKLNDISGAIEVFKEALSEDHTHPAARKNLEAMLGLTAAASERAPGRKVGNQHRLEAALALEPSYRAIWEEWQQQSQGTSNTTVTGSDSEPGQGLLNLLRVKVELGDAEMARDARLEGAALAEEAAPDGALWFVERGLTAALADSEDALPWIERLAHLAERADQRLAIAAILERTLGDGTIVDNPLRFALASRAAEAYERGGNVEKAIALYERAFAFAPRDEALFDRLDALLRANGSDQARLRVVDLALASCVDETRMQKLRLHKARIQLLGSDRVDDAIATYTSILGESPDQHDAHLALVEIFEAKRRVDDLEKEYIRRTEYASAGERFELWVKLLRLTLQTHHRDVAETYAAKILDDLESQSTDDAALLEQCVAILETLAKENGTLLVRALEARANASHEDRERIDWLVRLGRQHLANGDAKAARNTLFSAAERAKNAFGEDAAEPLLLQVMEVAPLDGQTARELSELYARRGAWGDVASMLEILVETTPDETKRAQHLLQLARVYGDSLGDHKKAVITTARAFKLTPRDPSMLEELERHAEGLEAMEAFARAIEAALPGLDGDIQAQARVARARVLSKDALLAGDVIHDLRDLLTSLDSYAADNETSILASFDAVLSRYPDRRNDKRWLNEWRLERAAEEDKLNLVLAWARDEENLGEQTTARLLFQQALAIDPKNVDALDAVANLCLDAGEVKTALVHLEQLAQAVAPENVAEVDLRVARILFDHASDPEGGLARLERVLNADPLNAEAHKLLPKAFARHDTAERATALVDQCRSHASSPEEAKQMLAHVLAQPGRSSARSRWFVELVNECREEGDSEGAFQWASRGVHEDPRLMTLWDVLEELVGSGSVDVGKVTECYADALHGAEPDVAASLGERAVLFLEEWIDDSTTIARVLETILASDMSLSWAFDRLKLIYDREERWADMFSLYDRAIERAERAQRIELLEEISQIAKDFALDANRAISYLERLYELRTSSRVFTALERLYERNGRPRELITLLSTRLAHDGTDVEATRTRIAGLWLDDLGEFSQALGVIEEILAARQGEFPPDAKVLEDMLERILRLAPTNVEVASQVMPSLAPPPSRTKKGEAKSTKRGLVRQRAAAILKERFAGGEREEDLVRVLELELETLKGTKDRIARHQLVAQKYEELGMPENALEHRVSLLLFEPESDTHLQNLESVVEKTERYDRLADVLSQAGEETEDANLRARLFTRAGRVSSERLEDTDRAISLLLRVLDDERVDNDGQLHAARAAEPLLRRAGRTRDQLAALERMAALETEAETRLTVLGQGGRLAEELGEQERAIALWRGRLETAPADLESLERLAALYEAVSAYRDLAQILEELGSVHQGEVRLGHMQRAAKLYSAELDMPARAIELWQTAEADFGTRDESTLALVDLYRRVGDRVKLAEALRRAAERTVRADRRAALFRELGDVLLGRDEIASAVEAYREALEAEPGDEPSRRGLETCAVDDACAERAIELLMQSFRTTQEWTRLQGLLSRRLEITVDDAARIKVLREHAEVAELRQDDAARAFELIRDAFLLGPEDASLEEELTRLGDVTQNWSAVSKAYHQGLDKTEKQTGVERAWLSAYTFRVGRYVETRLDDSKAALVHYERVWKADPTHKDTVRALTRAGAQVGEWSLVFEAFVDKTVREGKIDDDHKAFLESNIHDKSAWDDATRALERATENVKDTAGIAVLRDLEHLAARWHKDERRDFDASERALARALTFAPDDPTLLAAIASLQRRSRGRPLVESLLRLSRATGGDLDLLEEAAETARGHVADDALTTSIYEEMLSLARDRWLSGGADSPMLGSPRKPEAFVQIAYEGLKAIHENHGAWETLADLALRVSKLPWPKRERQRLVLEAARVRARKLEDRTGALGLYAGLFDEEPLDTEIAPEFMALLASEERWEELLAALGVRKRLFTEESALVSTMVEIANIHVRLKHGDAAREALTSGLDRFPANETLLGELGKLLTAAGKQRDYVLTLDAHAKRVQETDASRSRELSIRAGSLAEHDLKDLELAHTLYEQAATLGPHVDVFRALARVSHADGQFVKEAEHLAKLRQLTQGEERRKVTLEVAEAWLRGRKTGDASAVLENELETQPEAEELRERLATIYRESESWESLAKLQVAWTHWVENPSRRAQLLYDAGRIYLTDLGNGATASELLERAASELPEDDNTRSFPHGVEKPLDRRRVNLALAEALGTAGRVDEARALLRTIIDGFGSRKPKERARVHYTLARLDTLAGSEEDAVRELETATRIDPADTDILRALGEMRRKRGELEQSERAYRALLAAQRRHDRSQKRGALADVLVELWDIALAMKQADRAAELFESAMEIAAEGGTEAEAFERALFKKGAFEHVATMMTRRLKTRGDSASASEWATYGDLLGVKLGRLAESADAYLRAINMTREVDTELVQRARVGVKAAGRSADLAKALADAATRVTAKDARASFRIASAEVAREDLGDAGSSLGVLREILADFPGHELALSQLDETLTKLGKHQELADVIRTRMEAEPQNVFAHGMRLVRLLAGLDDASGAARALGELASNVADASTLFDLAKELAAKFPTNDEVLSAQEELFITAGDMQSTADVVLARYLLPSGTDDHARRALDLLDERGDKAAVEAALKRILEKADASTEIRLWALIRLAEIREAAGDIRETVLLRREATEIAGDDEARDLLFNIGSLAREKLKDLPLATEMFEQLAARGELDVRVWEPLLGLYRDLGELDKLVALIDKVQDNVSDPSERAQLRLESARVQATRMGVDDALAKELAEIVEIDPTLTDATTMLLDHYDRQNKHGEAIALIEGALAESQSRGAAEATERLALALVDRLGDNNERVAEVLDSALSVASESVLLLRRVDRLYQDQGETESSGRADALERLIPIAHPIEAAAVALELARIRTFNEDPEGAVMALERGFQRAPTDPRLTTRLEQAFTQGEQFDKLASLYETMAEHAADVDQKVTLFLQAAKVVREQLSDTPRAITMLRGASQARPDKMEPLLELVEALFANGDYDDVVAEVERGLPHAAMARPRVTLYTARARAKMAREDEDGAIVDWEEALGLGVPTDTGFPLAEYVDFLAEAGARARESQNSERATGLFERAAEVAEAMGDSERAADFLRGMLELTPDNGALLRRLGELEERRGATEGALIAYQTLLSLGGEGATLEAALKVTALAEAAERLDVARETLEWAHASWPHDTTTRTKLEEIYGRQNALPELAELYLADAERETDANAQFASLVRAGALLVDVGTDLDRAILVLDAARALKPQDCDCSALLSDSYARLGRLQEAHDTLQNCIALHKGRRVKDLSPLFHRLARIAEAVQDTEAELSYLTAALDMDPQNGDVAAELSLRAIPLQRWELANRALRTVTMLKTECSMSKAQAYFYQGQVAAAQGDPKKAQMLYKRAVDEDPNFVEARTAMERG